MISAPVRRDLTVAVSAADVTFRDLLKDPAERDVTPGYEPFDMGDLAASNMVEVDGLVSPHAIHCCSTGRH